MDSTTPDGRQTPPAPARHSEVRRPPEYLRWPPPGLDRIQGDLARILGELLVGGILLVLPLLWLLRQGEGLIWPVGPSRGGWLVLGASGLGLVLLLVAFVRVFRILRRAAQGTDLGYDLRTVALVAADSRRDTGLLLQGGQVFSVLDEPRRRTVANMRIRTASLWLAGALWPPLGFATGILIAERGLLSASGLTKFVLVPTAVLLSAGYILRAWENGVLQKARRVWHRGPWAKDFEMGEIQLWLQRSAAARGGAPPKDASRSIVTSRRLRIAMWAVIPALLLIGVPLLTVGIGASVGPIFAEIAVPQFGESARRIGESQPLWPYRAPIDSTITPQAAADALRALEQVGAGGLPDFGPAPVRRYSTPFDPLSDDWGSISNYISLYNGVAFLFVNLDSWEEEEVAFLREAAQHPALDELAILGRANELDVVSAFWPAPYPEDFSSRELPIPQFGVVRDAVYLAVVRAAMARREGRNDEAEKILREVIAVGLLLGRDSPYLIGSMMGALISKIGGEALVAFYNSVERTAEAGELAASLELAKKISESSAPEGILWQGASIENFPDVVTDTTLPRGLRWEHFNVVSMVAPCASVGRILFGADEFFTRWRDRARAELVRFPSEEAYFDLASRGPDDFSPDTRGLERGLPMRLITAAIGDRGAGDCVNMLEGWIELM